MPPADELSWSLIGRAADGDPTARDTFSSAYLPVVRRFFVARWRNTPWSDTVDDAVQEVFIECLRDDGALRKASAARGDLGGFLFGVSRNVAQRFEQRAAREHDRNQAVGSAIELVHARETTLSVSFDRGWALTLVRLAGERMQAAAQSGTEGQQLRARLLQMRFGEGMPIREIAARWRAEPRQVHHAYEKARKEFHEVLRQVMAEHGALPDENPDAAIMRLLSLLR